MTLVSWYSVVIINVMCSRDESNGARLSSEIEFNCYLLQFAHACMHDVVCIYIVGLPKLIIKLRSPAKIVLVNVDSSD